MTDFDTSLRGTLFDYYGGILFNYYLHSLDFKDEIGKSKNKDVC